MEADYVVSKLFATNEMKYNPGFASKNAFKLEAEVVKSRMKNLH